MKFGPLPNLGYTLVEVIIVLAVTGTLLASTIVVVSGRYQETAFSGSIRDIESKIQDVINDVSTGLSVDLGNTTCTVNGASAPTFLPSFSDTAQGSSKPCVFIGRAMQFGVSSLVCSVGLSTECTDYAIYTLIGRRDTASGGTPHSLSEALPVPLSPFIHATYAGVTVPDHSENAKLLQGLKVTRVVSSSDDPTFGVNYGTIAFTTTFGHVPGNSTATASQQVHFLAVPTTTLGQTKDQAAKAIFDNLGAMTETDSRLSPSGGIKVCFESANTKHRASISIGDNSHTTLTYLEIDPPAGHPCA